MIEDIISLREKGYSFRKIAQELKTTVGKVQYRYQKNQEEINKKIVEHSRSIQEIPSSYERDEVTLLPQSPTVIYSYWELSGALRQMSEQQCRTAWHELKKHLRVYDCTMLHFNGHNAHRYIDIFLPEITNNWMIHGLEPNRTYIVDVGVWTRQGSFLTLVRSNAIDTPRADETAKGIHVHAVHQWKNGVAAEPEWLEHFSTYSYYETIK